MTETYSHEDWSDSREGRRDTARHGRAREVVAYAACSCHEPRDSRRDHYASLQSYTLEWPTLQITESRTTCSCSPDAKARIAADPRLWQLRLESIVIDTIRGRRVPPLTARRGVRLRFHAVLFSPVSWNRTIETDHLSSQTLHSGLRRELSQTVWSCEDDISSRFCQVRSLH